MIEFLMYKMLIEAINETYEICIQVQFLVNATARARKDIVFNYIQILDAMATLNPSFKTKLVSWLSSINNSNMPES